MHGQYLSSPGIACHCRGLISCGKRRRAAWGRVSFQWEIGSGHQAYEGCWSTLNGAGPQAGQHGDLAFVRHFQ